MASGKDLRGGRMRYASAELLLSAALEAVQGGVLILDPELTVVRHNTVMERWVGRPFVGEKCHRAVWGRADPCEGCQSLLAMEEKRPCSRLVHPPLKPDRVRSVEVSSYPILDKSGRVFGAVEHAHDATPREQAELEVCERESLYRGLFANVQDAILIMDDQGRFLDANPAFAALTGYSYEEVMDLALWDITPENFRAEGERVWRSFMKDGRAEGEYLARRKDGSVFRAEYRAVAGVTAGTNVAIIRDVTERHEAEERLKSYQRRLAGLARSLAESEDRQRRRLAEDLHDHLGQNIAAISLDLQALRGAELSDRHAEALERAIGTLRSTATSIRSMTFDLCPPMLHEIGLGPALASLTERFDREHEALFLFKDAGTPRPLDENLASFLYRAGRELLVNAAKHSGASCVRMSLEMSGHRLALSVIDNGRGFDAGDEGASSPESTGFGLFNIAERASGFRGKLEMKTLPEGGAAAILSLPLS